MAEFLLLQPEVKAFCS